GSAPARKRMGASTNQVGVGLAAARSTCVASPRPSAGTTTSASERHRRVRRVKRRRTPEGEGGRVMAWLLQNETAAVSSRDLRGSIHFQMCFIDATHE